jgi:hypothetical protein
LNVLHEKLHWYIARIETDFQKQFEHWNGEISKFSTSVKSVTKEIFKTKLDPNWWRIRIGGVKQLFTGKTESLQDEKCRNGAAKMNGEEKRALEEATKNEIETEKNKADTAKKAEDTRKVEESKKIAPVENPSENEPLHLETQKVKPVADKVNSPSLKPAPVKKTAKPAAGKKKK